MLKWCLLLLFVASACAGYPGRYRTLYKKCYNKYRRASYCRTWCLKYIRHHPYGAKRSQAVSNAFSAKGAAKALSLGRFNQDALANALGKTATAGALAKHGNAISNALGVFGAQSISKTSGGGHAISQATSLKGHAHAHAFNYGKGNSFAVAHGRKRRSAYQRSLRSKCNLKAVGLTATSGALTKHGHAISGVYGVYGANSKALTHRGGHAFSQSHSKGNSNLLSANYGKGNSISYATGRKKRSAYEPYVKRGKYPYGKRGKYYPFGGHHNVVSNSLAVHGAAKSLSLGHYGQNAISKAVGLTATSGALTKHGHAISGAYGVYGANSKALTHGGGHAFSQSHSKGNSNSLSANYGKGNSISYATGRKKRSAYEPYVKRGKYPHGKIGKYPHGKIGKYPHGKIGKYPHGKIGKYPHGKRGKYYPFGGHHNVVSNSLAVHGAAKSLSLGHYGQNAISKAVGLTATSGALTKHGNAISGAYGVYGANSKALTHGGGHAFSQSHSKGNSNSLSANYGKGNSISYATGRRKRSAYAPYVKRGKYPYGKKGKYYPFGGHHNVVSNSLAVHGAAKSLSLGHYGQNAISKAVGLTATSGALTKHGHAISGAYGVYGANSKALTHGGGHAFSQAHSKGNSNSLSANYGKGNSISYATGRKRRSVYVKPRPYPKKYHHGHYPKKYYPFGGHHNVVSNSLAAHGAAKSLSLGHYGQNAISKAVGLTATSGALTKHGHAISGAYGVYGANSKALTHGGGHAFSQAHSKGNSNSLSANYGKGNSISYATGRKRRSVYVNHGYYPKKYHHGHYPKKYYPLGGRHNVVSNSLAVHGAAKSLSLGHYGQNAISKAVGLTATSGALTKHGHAISGAYGVYGANSKALTHGGGHAFSQSHSKGNSNSLSANYGKGHSISYATGRKRRSIYAKPSRHYPIKKHYYPFGGRHNVVSNSLAVHGAAKSLSLGHYGQNAISKAVGLTATSGALTKHGHAISGAYGVYGANSKALTHGGGHAFSQSHSKGNSNSLSANYGKGNSISYATGRKRRSVSLDNPLSSWLYRFD